jgi:hypothetical protein
MKMETPIGAWRHSKILGICSLELEQIAASTIFSAASAPLR